MSKTNWQVGSGLYAGPGWDRLINPLIELCNLKGVSIHQIKEKFGTLRFYADMSELDEIIDAVEAQSGRTCEDCGEHGYDFDSELGINVPKATTSPRSNGYWLKTLCKSCRLR